jgi:hypothetical protein
MSRESAEPVDAQEQPDNIASPRYTSTINKGYFRVPVSNLRVPDIESDQKLWKATVLEIGRLSDPHGPAVIRHPRETSPCVTLPQWYGDPLILPDIQL